jgi:hypothetical protein
LGLECDLFSGQTVDWVLADGYWDICHLEQARQFVDKAKARHLLVFVPATEAARAATLRPLFKIPVFGRTKDMHGHLLAW